ncbi:MAG TPA: hypothetical protein ENI43_03595 [Firmicutes bacterium]|nr:hypothetical protein [Bacillota bacterium]
MIKSNISLLSCPVEFTELKRTESIVELEKSLSGNLPLWLILYFVVVFIISVLIVLLMNGTTLKFLIEVVFLLIAGLIYARLSILAEDIAFNKKKEVVVEILGGSFDRDRIKDALNGVLCRSVIIRNVNKLG